MSIQEICVLNCVEDAADMLISHHKNAKEQFIVSWHSAVCDYLKSYQIECRDLSEWIDNKNIWQAYLEADEKVNSHLKRLDLGVGVSIMRNVGLPNMALFGPLYRYLGKSKYQGYRLIWQALNTVFEEISPKQVVIYESRQENVFDSDSSAIDLVQALAKKYNFNIVVRSMPTSTNTQLGSRFMRMSRYAWRQLRYPWEMERPRRVIKRYYRKFECDFAAAPKFTKESPTVLLMEPLKEYELVESMLRTTNVVHWPSNSVPRWIRKRYDKCVSSVLGSLELDTFKIDVQSKGNAVDAAFVKSLSEDIISKTQEYLKPLLYVKCLDEEVGISAAVWGISVGLGQNALIAEYMLSKGRSVVGCEHGGNFGIQDVGSCHVDSDFRFCTHYLTYGFSMSDIRELNLSSQPCCEFVPVGWPRAAKAAHRSRRIKRKKIDILFPLTNASFLAQNYLRVSPAIIAGYQREILSYLDSITDRHVVVKPFPGSSAKNCSCMEQLKRMRNAKVMWDLPLQECLERYDVLAAIVEYPSQPLYEMIPYDIELFMMTDSVAPFTRTPFEAMEKRVHIFEKLPELLSSLSMWRAGLLTPKRDKIFEHKYLRSTDTEVHVKQFFQRLLQPSNREG